MVERTKYTTRLGELSWVFITGNGKRNYNDDGDIYAATITLAGDAAKETAKEIDAFYEENKVKGLAKGSTGYFHPYIFDDNGEKIPLLDADGKVIPDKWKQDENLVSVTFKTGVKYPDGSPKVIQVYNSKGNKVSLGETRIGNGSTGCLAGQMSMFERKKDQGVTFYLNSIQVVSLSSFEGGDSFQAHDGGFEGIDDASGIPVGSTTEEAEDEAPAKAVASPRL